MTIPSRIEGWREEGDSESVSLIHACLDSRASEEEIALLEERLLHDARFRDLYLRLADVHACLAVDETLWVECSPAAVVRAGDRGGSDAVESPPLPPVSRRPMSAAAIGIVVGALGASVALGCVSLAFGYVVPRLSQVRSRQRLLDEGFEAGPAPRPQGMPVVAGGWSGDFSAVVGAEQGVVPAHGERMLRLLRADYEGKSDPDSVSYVADMWRLFDLRPHRADVAEGGATARLSAAFNAAAFPRHEAYRCSFSFYVLDAATVGRLDPSDVGRLIDLSLATVHAGTVFLDRDPRTWQAESSEIRLPASTDYLMVRIGVTHVTNDQRRVDFPGHYVDDIQLFVETVGQASP